MPLDRRQFTIYCGFLILGAPSFSHAFIQGFILRTLIRGLIRSAGRASRPMARTIPRRGSRVYAYVPSPVARQLAAERRALLAERLNRQQKDSFKRSLRLTDEDLPYVSSRDREKLVRNAGRIIDRIDTLNDISDLVDFVRKFDNTYEAVFELAREEIESNSNLNRQFAMVTEGIDLTESEIIWDRNLERRLRRLRSPFVNF